MNKIHAIKALEDNYIWAIHGIDNAHIIVVDPGEAEPVISYMAENNLILDGILLTHHHWDHVGGVETLVQRYPGMPVYSSMIDKVEGVTDCVQEGQEISFKNLAVPIKVIEIPGHTLGHIAFCYQKALFCGDTLFSCGCGRIFEGTAIQMYHSLQKLKQLPADTLVYCAHEYTLANIAFAQVVDPNNKILENRKKQVEDLRKNNKPSLPVLLEIELKTNPFLRCEEDIIIASVKKQAKTDFIDPASIFSQLREWKNKF